MFSADDGGQIVLVELLLFSLLGADVAVDVVDVRKVKLDVVLVGENGTVVVVVVVELGREGRICRRLTSSIRALQSEI